MKAFLLIASIVLIFTYPAFCQIDTLQLVEIGSIQAPSAINELYVEDLDGDSLKEIILCTDSYVYIYNSQTYEVEWTSPPLNHPADLLFEDINRDGFIDFSVKDNINIYLFDPHTPQTIWTSPELGDMYACYSIGDRNDDGWIDIVVVKKEELTRFNDPVNMDTVWVNIYDGPDFSESDSFHYLLWEFGVSYPHFYDVRIENPFKISVHEITGSAGVEIKMLIFSQTRQGWISYYNGYPEMYYTGSLWVFDAADLTGNPLADFEGRLLFYEYSEGEDSTVLNTISCRFDTTYYDGEDNYWDVSTCSADSMLYSSDIYNWHSVGSGPLDWDGLISGNISENSDGLETFYSAEDILVLLTFPEVDTLRTQEVLDIDSVLHSFVDSFLFDSPQIICAMGAPLDNFQFFSGSDGSLSAVLPDSGYELSRVSDLGNDLRDEILSIQDTRLVVYDLDYATGISDETRLPYHAFLRPNYPNPFNSSTTIEYGLPEAGRVRIDIYDLLGRKVETLVDEDVPAGRHQVMWDASAYSSGVYFYRIEAEDFVDTKRMLYLK